METVLSWIADRDGMTINEYMARHKNNENANELFDYFCTVIHWARTTFPVYRKEMKNIPWGIWYNIFKEGKCTGPMAKMTPEQIEAEIARLIADDEVQTVKGIYEYLFTGDPRHLSLREFDLKTKRMVYEKQKHRCVYCEREGDMAEYAFEDMHADHIRPWSKGGKTVEENCQMLCKKHNEKKSDKW